MEPHWFDYSFEKYRLSPLQENSFHIVLEFVGFQSFESIRGDGMNDFTG